MRDHGLGLGGGEAQPVNAERAWNRADSPDIPEAASTTVATRVTSSETASTARSDAIAYMSGACPDGQSGKRLPEEARPKGFEPLTF